MKNNNTIEKINEAQIGGEPGLDSHINILKLVTDVK
jgi:hypothetical protein